jgi:hypothetical protein
MENKIMGTPPPPYLDPAWLWAQILATQRMVTVLAKGRGVAPEWKLQSTQQIQQLRDHMLNSAAPDAAIDGLDAALAYLAKVSDPHK